MLIFGWLFFSIAAAMFAHIRRNRSSGGWLLVALFFSPLVAFVLLLILQPLPRKMRRREIIARLAELRAKEAEVASKVDPRWINLAS